jgi:hypothetical protein
MVELETDINGAITWIESWYRTIVTDFLTARDELPSWGPDVDPQVQQYIDALGSWVRANDAWSFESERYFGKAGREIQEKREVALLPRLSTKSAASDTLGSQPVGLVIEPVKS